MSLPFAKNSHTAVAGGSPKDSADSNKRLRGADSNPQNPVAEPAADPAGARRGRRGSGSGGRGDERSGDRSGRGDVRRDRADSRDSREVNL